MVIRARRLQHAALLLALFGVLLRGAIPAGFMPAFGKDADRGAWLALCSGGELRRAASTGTRDDAGHALQMQQECPYATAATPALPSMPPQLASDDMPAQFVALHSSSAAPPRQLPELPPARGPPALS